MQNIIQTNGLTKEIKGKTLIQNAHIHVAKGEIYGFLGPNGAGKTTTMKMLTNLWKPSSGEIFLFGERLQNDSYEVLKRMGIMIEFPAFYEKLSGKENLELHAEYMGFYSNGSIEKALKLLELSNTRDQAVKSYSLGMKQRLGIARAILTKPELLILDEPTNGLDPAGIKQIRNLLKMLAKDYGITIMISSHLLAEVENLADMVGLINHGKMIKEISMKEIIENNMTYIELKTPDIKHASYVLVEKMGIQKFKIVEDNKIRIYEQGISVQELTKVLTANDAPIDYLNRQSESLEDYFLKMTGEVNYHA